MALKAAISREIQGQFGTFWPLLRYVPRRTRQPTPKQATSSNRQNPAALLTPDALELQDHLQCDRHLGYVPLLSRRSANSVFADPLLSKRWRPRTPSGASQTNVAAIDCSHRRARPVGRVLPIPTWIFFFGGGLVLCRQGWCGFLGDCDG